MLTSLSLFFPVYRNMENFLKYTFLILVPEHSKLRIQGKFTEKEFKEKKNHSFEPDSNQRPKDTISTSTVLRSTN